MIDRPRFLLAAALLGLAACGSGAGGNTSSAGTVSSPNGSSVDSGATTTAPPTDTDLDAADGAVTDDTVDEPTEPVAVSTGDSAVPSTEPSEPPVTDPDAPASTVDGPATDDAATDEDPVGPGEVAEIPDRWELQVTSVNLDADELVASFDPVNPPPPPGSHYVLVAIAGTYLGQDAAQPVFDWALSDGTNEFTPSIPGCGLVPGSLFDIEALQANDSFGANLCVAVPAASIESGLELFLKPLDDRAWYFTLE
ncbi:MAG: hypothetical protein R2715_22740 [Ilumatobacteraceae bacterium]